jgi:hypothetical protein
MVEYTLSVFKNGVLQNTVENLSLQEAYVLAKPPQMNPHNNRWHFMMYSAVVERIGKLIDGEPLLVAYEEEMGTMDCVYKYIKRTVQA